MRKVFVFAGQSNAMGYGDKIQLNPVPGWAQNAANGWTGAPTASSDTNVQYPKPTPANAPSLYNENNSGLISYVTDGWGPYDGCNPSTGPQAGERPSYGPELSFLARYRAANPTHSIAAIKCVLGGSSLEEWLPGQNMWAVLSLHISQATARLNAAGQPWEWAGFVWHQGESGCSSVWPYLNPTPGAEYSDKLRQFLSAVRGITSPTMPCVIARIGSHMLATNIIGTASSGIDTPANRTAATNYRRAQQVLVGGDPGNVWVDTDGLPVLQSGSSAYWYHHTGAGYLAMGERMYAAFAGAQPPPPPPPPLAVKFNGVSQPWSIYLNGTAIGGPGDVIDVVG